MKITAKLTIIALCILCVAGMTFAKKKDRKLTVGAYLSSAKIEIVSGDPERYETAILYLDSLFINYGPHAEGIYLMGQILVDYMEKTPDLKEKKGYVERLVAYSDSLKMCCENKDIKKKHRKDCDKYMELADSVKVSYWRTFYNSAIEQLNRIDELQGNLATAADSSEKAWFEEELNATHDSCVTNLEMVTVLNTSDHRGYVGLGKAYEKTGDYQKAIEHLDKGLEELARAEAENPDAAEKGDRTSLLFSMAIYYIQLDDFCGAIPYFKEYTEAFPGDTSTLYNLQACYNNCDFYDSAMMVNQEILNYAPQNLDALTAIGLYHNQRARVCSDTATYYTKQDDEATAQAWRDKRNVAFDSAMVYFKVAAEAHPNDIMALEQYGTLAGLREKYADAAIVFRTLADLDPNSAEYPRAAGDFFLRSKEFTNAITEYERTVERDASDKETWERLADLYHNEGMTDKETQAKKKIEELK